MNFLSKMELIPCLLLKSGQSLTWRVIILLIGSPVIGISMSIYIISRKWVKLMRLKRNHPNLGQTHIPENAVNTPVTMKTDDGYTWVSMRRIWRITLTWHWRWIHPIFHWWATWSVPKRTKYKVKKLYHLIHRGEPFKSVKQPVVW